MRSHFRFTWPLALVALSALALVNTGCTDDTKAATICVVTGAGGTDQQIQCEDGTVIDVSDGGPGEDGRTCTATENEDGTVSVSCDDGTEAIIVDGQDGEGCSVFTEDDGSVTITCEDGSESTVNNGDDGSSCSVAEVDGEVTVSCTDGTNATVQNGEPGGTCGVTSTDSGVTITCDDGTTVEVNDGAEGTSCTTTTDPETDDLLIECEDGTKVVIVEGGNDASFLGVAVLVGADDNSGILVEILDGEEVVASGTTEADGSYRIDGVDPGTYAARFTFGEYIPITLPNIIGLPGENYLPDVTLRLDEQIARIDDVFIVDVCVDGETSEATGILWLEDYQLETEFMMGGGGPRATGVGFEELFFALMRPGSNPLPLAASGRLVHYDPASGERTTLGEDVISFGVHCSPDGQAVAFLENIDFFLTFQGNLVIWEDGVRAVVMENVGEDLEPVEAVSTCGLQWSPTGSGVAFLSGLYPGYYYGAEADLYVWERGASEADDVDYPVACDDFFINAQGDFIAGNGPDDAPDSLFASFPEYEWSPNGENLRYRLNYGEWGELAYYRLSDQDQEMLAEYDDVFRDIAGYSPDGQWIIYHADDGWSKEAYLFDTTAGDGVDPFTPLSTDGSADPGDRFWAWSSDSQYVAHTDNANVSYDFDLEVWQIGGDQVGAALAVNLSNFTWTWATDDSGVLFAAEEVNEPVIEAAGQGSLANLAFWDVGTQEITTYSNSVGAWDLEASYNPDGDRMIFVEYFNGASLGDIRIVEDGVVLDDLFREGVFAGNTGPSWESIWSPEGDSVVVFETSSDYYGGGFGPGAVELWLYGFAGEGGEELLSYDTLSRYMPVQYEADGTALLVYGFEGFGGIDFLPVVTLTEWDDVALAGTVISDQVIYASYSETGESAFYIDVDPNQDFDAAPKGDAYRWTTLGGISAEVDTRIDLFSNFAHRANDAAWAQRNFGFPDVERNGPHNATLP